jgi:hypothetical protein
MTPASPPDGFCPNCGTRFVDARPVCGCGHSYYPREQIKPVLPGFKPMTDDEKRAARGTAGLFLGILSIVGFFSGPYGMIAAGMGMLLSLSGMKAMDRRRAVAGLICSTVGLVASGVGTYFFVKLIAPLG